MKKSFDLTILNHKFTIKSDSSEKHVKQVADFVNKKMHEIVSGNQAISTANVAILAALNIADDMYKMKEEYQNKTSHWINKVNNLVQRLDQL